MDPGKKLRIVVTGKGGVGKTTLTALLAHCFAGEGMSVLAIDGDPQQNLAATLGVCLSETNSIIPISERKEYIAEKIGTGAGRGGFFVLNPETADVVDRFSKKVGERIRLLVLGGIRNAGSGCLCPEYTLLSALLRNAVYLPGDVVILDTPAGLEHFGRSIAQGFNAALIVSDSSYNAMTVAKELSRLANQCGIPEIILVLNKSGPMAGISYVRNQGDTHFTKILRIPDDPLIMKHEPSVIPLIKAGSPVVQAVRQMMQAMMKTG
jgi:CO dehydrogenase maturation factor